MRREPAICASELSLRGPCSQAQRLSPPPELYVRQRLDSAQANPAWVPSA